MTAKESPQESSGGSWSDIIATDWGVDIWDPPVYTQVIRGGQVSTYESKTKIYFGVRQNVTIAACCAAPARAELYPATYKPMLQPMK